MNFRKTTEYAFRIMSFMATDEHKTYRVDDIYEALKIPYRFLRKQMTLMVKNKLIKSIQGKNGGYKLNKDIHEISLSEIVTAMEDPVFNSECFFGYETCLLTNHCLMHDKWAKLRNSITEILETTTLFDIKEKKPHGFMNINHFLLT